MSKLLILLAAVVAMTLGCGLVEGDPTPSPTRTPRPTSTPTPTATPKPTPTRTPRPTFALFPGTGGPSGIAANNVNDARNLVWVYLSRCASFDPVDLDAYKVGNFWYVKADDGARQQYGIWKVDSLSGSLSPHDPLAAEWEAMLASDCLSGDRARLVMPTVTPTPTRPPPSPTPLLRSNSDAVNVLWSYLVKCFPTLATTDLEATLDPSQGAYIVKDNDVAMYGVWQVDRADGEVSPDNDRARSRDQTVKRGAC